MPTNPSSPNPDKLWDVLPQIVSRLRNEFLLFTFGYIILIIAVGIFAPGVVALLGRELFYLLILLAFAAYVALRVLDTWAKLHSKRPAKSELQTPSTLPGTALSKLTSKTPQSRPLTFPTDPVAEATGGNLNRANLLQLITDNFNNDELQELCFVELEINYEDVPGQTNRSKARELIAYCERRGRIAELVEAVRKARPQAL